MKYDCVLVCFFQLPHLCHRPEILTSAGWKKDTLASGSSILCVCLVFLHQVLTLIMISCILYSMPYVCHERSFHKFLQT